MSMRNITLNVNTREYKLQVDEDMPLLWALRDLLNLKGTKFGCGKAMCGACTVQLNGQPIRSCSLPAVAVKGKITTIEGLSPDGSHPLQQAWVEADVPQCGYCQAGQIMSAAALLTRKSNPTDEEISSALAGHICRCGTYTRIRKAIHLAAEKGGNHGK
jgi:isoquinoline 1-oxidoreductase alpha subunit